MKRKCIFAIVIGLLFVVISPVLYNQNCIRIFSNVISERDDTKIISVKIQGQGVDKDFDDKASVECISKGLKVPVYRNDSNLDYSPKGYSSYYRMTLYSKYGSTSFFFFYSRKDMSLFFTGPIGVCYSGEGMNFAKGAPLYFAMLPKERKSPIVKTLDSLR